MKKIDVNGQNEHPVYTYLKSVASSEEYKGLKAKATQKMLKTHAYWQRWGATEFYRDSESVYYKLNLG